MELCCEDTICIHSTHGIVQACTVDCVYVCDLGQNGHGREWDCS